MGGPITTSQVEQAVAGAEKALGIHPKVKIPSVALAALGAALVAIGVVTGDKVTLDAGVAVAGSSGLGGFLGYLTPGGVS